MKRHTTGVLNGIIAAVSYGANPLFALPIISAGIGINSVLFYRYAFALIIYAIGIKCIKHVSLKISRKEFFILFFLGVFFSLSSLLLYESFKYIEAGIACTILFIYPILVAIIMSIFYREKITRTTVSSIALTLTGIVFLYNGKPNMVLNKHGIICVLLSALLYAIYIVGIKNFKTIKHIKADKLNFYVMLFGLLVYVFNLKFCTELQILHSPFLWLCALGLAIFPTIISIETINIAIKLIGSTKTAILGALEPITAIFFGLIFFNEHLTLRIVNGVSLILLGVIILVSKRNNKLKAKN